MKDEFTTYMSKKQATDFAPGTEEMNPDDLEQLSEVENQQITQEALESIFPESLTVMQAPTFTSPGVFQLIILPAVEQKETVGCHVALKMSYISTISENMVYEVLPEASGGLTNEQLEQLSFDIKVKEEQEGELCHYQTIIEVIEDFLSGENANTKMVVQEQVAEEERLKQLQRAEEAERQRKKVIRHMQ